MPRASRPQPPNPDDPRTAHESPEPAPEPPSDPSAQYIAELVAGGRNPFVGDAMAFVNDIARGQTGGPQNVRDDRIPLYPTCPTGEEAKTLCEKVGLPLETLRRALTLHPHDFDGWLRGERAIVNENFDPAEQRSIGRTGVRRVFGVIEAYLRAAVAPKADAAA